MVQVRAIRSEEDYEAALARISELMDALSGQEGQMEDPDDPRRVELEVLVDLVEFYESRSDNWGLPGPVSAIEFRMEQANLTQRDLVPFIGSRAKVSEILSGKRRITMSMARALHQHLGIPAAVLLQEPGATFQDNEPDLEYSRFPLAGNGQGGLGSQRPKPEGPWGGFGHRSDGTRRRETGRHGPLPEERQPSDQRQDR